MNTTMEFLVEPRLTPPQVAKILHTAQKRVRSLCDRGVLEYEMEEYQASGQVRYYIRQSVVEAYIANRTHRKGRAW